MQKVSWSVTYKILDEPEEPRDLVIVVQVLASNLEVRRGVPSSNVRTIINFKKCGVLLLSWTNNITSHWRLCDRTSDHEREVRKWERFLLSCLLSAVFVEWNARVLVNWIALNFLDLNNGQLTKVME